MKIPTIMMAANAQECEQIFNGLQTIFPCKTAPEPPFKVVVYCTKAKPYIITGDYYCGCIDYNHPIKEHLSNGKVIGEFIVEKVEEIVNDCGKSESGDCWGDNIDDFKKDSCLTRGEIIDYMGHKDMIYALHITAPKLYDMPKELGEFYTVKKVRGYHKKDEPRTSGINVGRLLHSKRVEAEPLIRAPRNWCNVATPAHLAVEEPRQQPQRGELR